MDSLNGTKWRHKKRGSVYEIVDDDASIQINTTGDDEIEAVLEDAIWFAYRPVNGHKLYFRQRDEFLDGRFVQVTEAEAG